MLKHGIQDVNGLTTLAQIRFAETDHRGKLWETGIQLLSALECRESFSHSSFGIVGKTKIRVHLWNGGRELSEMFESLSRFVPFFRGECLAGDIGVAIKLGLVLSSEDARSDCEEYQRRATHSR